MTTTTFERPMPGGVATAALEADEMTGALAEQIRGDAIPVAALSFTRCSTRHYHGAHVLRTLRAAGWSSRLAVAATNEATRPYWVDNTTRACV